MKTWLLVSTAVENCRGERAFLNTEGEEKDSIPSVYDSNKSDICHCLKLHTHTHTHCTRLSSSSHHHSVHLYNARVNQYPHSFILLAGKLWSSMSASVFPSSYDFNFFKEISTLIF